MQANADQDDTSNEPKQCQDNADIEHDELGTLPDGKKCFGPDIYVHIGPPHVTYERCGRPEAR